MLHSICQQIWKTQQWPQDWKRSVFIPIPKKGNAKDCSSYHTIVLISQSSKVMFKIFQARLHQYMNHELPDVQAGFRKGKEPEVKLPTSVGSSKKQDSSRKTSISALLTMPKPLPVFSSVQLLSCVQLFVTPWITARQSSLSITNSWSSPKLMCIKSVMPSSHFILCHPFYSCPQSLGSGLSFYVGLCPNFFSL